MRQGLTFPNYISWFTFLMEVVEVIHLWKLYLKIWNMKSFMHSKFIYWVPYWGSWKMLRWTELSYRSVMSKWHLSFRIHNFLISLLRILCCTQPDIICLLVVALCSQKFLMLFVAEEGCARRFGYILCCITVTLRLSVYLLLSGHLGSFGRLGQLWIVSSAYHTSSSNFFRL